MICTRQMSIWRSCCLSRVDIGNNNVIRIVHKASIKRGTMIFVLANYSEYSDGSVMSLLPAQMDASERRTAAASSLQARAKCSTAYWYQSTN